jgi:hypothetical protein
MRGVSLFIFVVALPALAALGHDLYLFYLNYGLDSIERDVRHVIDEKGALSLFASLGFIWTQYNEESYKWVVENTDEETWALISEILTFKAVFVGAAFAGFFYVILGALRLLGAWPFSSGGIARFSIGTKTDSILGRKKSGPFKYKRK